jgi:hypothetical protein
MEPINFSTLRQHHRVQGFLVSACLLLRTGLQSLLVHPAGVAIFFQPHPIIILSLLQDAHRLAIQHLARSDRLRFPAQVATLFTNAQSVCPSNGLLPSASLLPLDTLSSRLPRSTPVSTCPVRRICAAGLFRSPGAPPQRSSPLIPAVLFQPAALLAPSRRRKKSSTFSTSNSRSSCIVQHPIMPA